MNSTLVFFLRSMSKCLEDGKESASVRLSGIHPARNNKPYASKEKAGNVHGALLPENRVFWMTRIKSRFHV